MESSFLGTYNPRAPIPDPADCPAGQCPEDLPQRVKDITAFTQASTSKALIIFMLLAAAGYGVSKTDFFK